MKAGGTRAPIAVLLLAVQLAGLAHLVLARHEICPEHGSIVEAGARQAGPAATEIATQSARGTTGTVESADDHCAYFATERRTLAFDLVAPATAHLPTLSSLPQSAARPPAAWALYRIAPKTSPPV